MVNKRGWVNNANYPVARGQGHPIAPINPSRSVCGTGCRPSATDVSFMRLVAKPSKLNGAVVGGRRLTTRKDRRDSERVWRQPLTTIGA